MIKSKEKGIENLILCADDFNIIQHTSIFFFNSKPHIVFGRYSIQRKLVIVFCGSFILRLVNYFLSFISSVYML